MEMEGGRKIVIRIGDRWRIGTSKEMGEFDVWIGWRT